MAKTAHPAMKTIKKTIKKEAATKLKSVKSVKKAATLTGSAATRARTESLSLT